MRLQKNFTFLIIDLNSGRYVLNRKGHEQFNFDNVFGKYFGYCPPKNGIDISKLGAKPKDSSISGITVVYTQKVPNSTCEREIVGFALNATIYRYPQNNCISKRKVGHKYIPYHVESDNLFDLRDLHHKQKIGMSPSFPYLLRGQRYFSGSKSLIDTIVRNYIFSYLTNGLDEDGEDFQRQVQQCTTNDTKSATSVPNYVNRESGVMVAKNVSVSKTALNNANFQCAVDSSHRTFMTPKGTLYMEGHHLIPCTYTNSQYFWTKFHRNIDCLENIVCLCPTCHRQIHFGSEADKRAVLTDLYNKKVNELRSIGIGIPLSELEKLYGL